MSKANGHDTVGFGCPNTTDPHHFVVDIPAGRSGFVSICEHYGIKAGINGLPEVAERCLLARPTWSLIAEDVKREFNGRLRSKKIATSRWLIGENKVERLLGKELLVLAWAVEHAAADTVPNAVRNWIGLRPEERWWLFTATAAASGRLDDGEIGWRKALRFALTENPLVEPMKVSVKRRPLKSRIESMEPMFSIFDEDNSPFIDNSSDAPRKDRSEL